MMNESHEDLHLPVALLNTVAEYDKSIVFAKPVLPIEAS